MFFPATWIFTHEINELAFQLLWSEITQLSTVLRGCSSCGSLFCASFSVHLEIFIFELYITSCNLTERHFPVIKYTNPLYEWDTSCATPNRSWQIWLPQMTFEHWISKYLTISCSITRSIWVICKYIFRSLKSNVCTKILGRVFTAKNSWCSSVCWRYIS